MLVVCSMDLVIICSYFLRSFARYCLKFLFAHLLQISCICGRRHLQPCPLWTLIVVIFEIIIDHLLYFLERGTSRKMTMILEMPEETIPSLRLSQQFPRLDMDCIEAHLLQSFLELIAHIQRPDLNGTGSLHGWYPSGYHPASRRAYGKILAL